MSAAGEPDRPREKKTYVPQEIPPRTSDRLDDDDYPAYTMGRAAELIGATPAFLRALGEAGLIVPLRSEGGHRRYSRKQLRTAARARELVDQGTPVEAACRIVDLEDRLDRAQRRNEELTAEEAGPGGDAGTGAAEDAAGTGKAGGARYAGGAGNAGTAGGAGPGPR